MRAECSNSYNWACHIVNTKVERKESLTGNAERLTVLPNGGNLYLLCRLHRETRTGKLAGLGMVPPVSGCVIEARNTTAKRKKMDMWYNFTPATGLPRGSQNR
jgi:hypothetical protein